MARDEGRAGWEGFWRSRPHAGRGDWRSRPRIKTNRNREFIRLRAAHSRFGEISVDGSGCTTSLLLWGDQVSGLLCGLLLGSDEGVDGEMGKRMCGGVADIESWANEGEG